MAHTQGSPCLASLIVVFLFKVFSVRPEPVEGLPIRPKSPSTGSGRTEYRSSGLMTLSTFEGDRMLRTIASLLAWLPLLATASPQKVERFDATTWAQLQKELPRPAVVVF